MQFNISLTCSYPANDHGLRTFDFETVDNWALIMINGQVTISLCYGSVWKSKSPNQAESRCRRGGRMGGTILPTGTGFHGRTEPSAHHRDDADGSSNKYTWDCSGMLLNSTSHPLARRGVVAWCIDSETTGPGIPVSSTEPSAHRYLPSLV